MLLTLIILPAVWHLCLLQLCVVQVHFDVMNEILVPTEQDTHYLLHLLNLDFVVHYTLLMQEHNFFKI